MPELCYEAGEVVRGKFVPFDIPPPPDTAYLLNPEHIELRPCCMKEAGHDGLHDWEEDA